MKEYKVYKLGDNIKEFWDEYINESVGGTIFHRYEWLKIAEKHSKMKFIPIAVNKGDKTVCILPLFYQKKYGIRILFSPPNGCGIPHLGPVFKIPSTNRYKYEKTYIDIIDELIQFMEKIIGYDYLRIIHTPDIIDMRPYVWNKYVVRPHYTYKFDITNNIQEIFNNFHSTTKNAIKKAINNNDIVISRDPKYLSDILALVKKRYKDQNRKFNISNNYLENLIDSSLSNNIESISIIHDENTIAGDIAITDRNFAYAWIGSVSRQKIIAGVGELVLWEKIKEYNERGYKSYDIIGANTRHICKHKAKYGANLVIYCVVQKVSLKGNVALTIMNNFKEKVQDQ